MKYTYSFLPPICLNELQDKAVHVSKVLSSTLWRKNNSIANLVLPCYLAYTGGRNGSGCTQNSIETTLKEYEQSMYVKYHIWSTSNFHFFSGQTAIDTIKAKNTFWSQRVLWFYTPSHYLKTNQSGILSNPIDYFDTTLHDPGHNVLFFYFLFFTFINMHLGVQNPM